MLKLHYHPLSSDSQKALMALYEKGYPFEPRVANPTRGKEGTPAGLMEARTGVQAYGAA